MVARKDKITIHDIARKASVSVGTVDRVIHERDGVSANTRKLVKQIINDLNYQPDILARTLASKKSLRISALFPGLNSGKSFWSIPEAGMDKATNELSHFAVQLSKYPFDQNDSSSFLTKAGKVLESKPDGIVLAPVFSKEASWFSLQCNQLNIPFIYINSQLKSEPYLSFIGQDSYASGRVAAQLLHDCIGKNDPIAIINIEQDPSNQVHLKERVRGFTEYSVRQLGKNLKQILSFTIPETSPQSINFLLQNIFEERKVKGIFITNSRAHRIANWVKSNSKEMPILVGYDLIVENRKLLNSGYIKFLISQKPEEQGYRSVMSLFNHLVLERAVPKNQILPIDIITSENLPFYNL